MRGRVNTDLYSGVAINASNLEGTVDNGINIVAGDFVEYTYDELVRQMDNPQITYICEDNKIYDLSSLADNLYIAKFDNILTLFTYENETIIIVDQYTPDSSYVDTWDRYDDTTFFANIGAGGVDIIQVSTTEITRIKSYAHNSGIESLFYYSDELAFGNDGYTVDITVFDCSDLENITALSNYNTLPQWYIVERTQHKIYSISYEAYYTSTYNIKLNIYTIDDTTHQIVNNPVKLGYIFYGQNIDIRLLGIKADEDGNCHLAFIYTTFSNSDTNKNVNLIILDVPTSDVTSQLDYYGSECIIENLIALDNSYSVGDIYSNIKCSIDYDTRNIVLAYKFEKKIHNVRYKAKWDFENSKEHWVPYDADSYTIKDTVIDFVDFTKSEHYINVINGLLKIGKEASLSNRYILLGDSYNSSTYNKSGYTEFSVRGDKIHYGFIDKVKPITIEANTAGIACESKTAGEKIKLYVPYYYTPSPSPSFKPVPWSSANLTQIANMLNAFYNDEINIYDYWSVGDERIVDLSAIPARSPLTDAHPAQSVTFVLANRGGKELTAPINGHTECAFVVVQKEVLDDRGMFNVAYDLDPMSWNNSDRKLWCNNEYYNAIPQDLRMIFKQHKNNINVWHQSTRTYTEEISNDYFTLPDLYEVFLSIDNKQLEWYRTDDNKIKKRYNSTRKDSYLTRTMSENYANISDNRLWLVGTNKDSSTAYVTEEYGLSPQGAI